MSVIAIGTQHHVNINLNVCVLLIQYKAIGSILLCDVVCLKVGTFCKKGKKFPPVVLRKILFP